MTLKRRLSEHHRGLQSGDVAASALADHTWSTGHHVDLSKAEVVLRLLRNTSPQMMSNLL